MKYGIVYASLAGGSEQSAKIIKDKLFFEHQIPENEIALLDLNKNTTIDLEHYDKCIIGTGIYAGKPNKHIIKFVQTNMESLLKIPVYLFICSLATDEENENYRKVFPENLLEHAIILSFFGGMVIFKRLNVFARIIMKIITKSKQDVHKLKYDVINRFIETVVKN